MQLLLNTEIATSYKSGSQKARVMTEAWVAKESFCPNCGNDISQFEENRPVADFFCHNCKEEYELKSNQKNSFGTKIVDGAYSTMIKRLNDSNNPNFFFLNYNLINYKIVNFIIIPKHFFIPQIIEKRKPLSKNAKRAGWVGCNILLNEIPNSGKIFYVKNEQIESKEVVISNWKKTLFLRDTKSEISKGWILEIIKCIERLNKSEFSLKDMYRFEEYLKYKYPKNNFIKEKIRQQLQFLRDKNYIEFISSGQYMLVEGK